MATYYPSPGGASSASEFNERPVCRHWKRGRCNAIKCNFPHFGPGGTSICRHFLRNRCNRADCRFIHPGNASPMPQPIPWCPVPASPMGFWAPRASFYHPGFYHPYQASGYMQAPPFWAHPGYNTTFYPPPSLPYYNHGGWDYGSGYQNDSYPDDDPGLYEQEAEYPNNLGEAREEEVDRWDSAGVNGSEVASKEEVPGDKEEMTAADINKKPDEKGEIEVASMDIDEKKPDEEKEMATMGIDKKPKDKEVALADIDKKPDDEVEEPKAVSPVIAMGTRL
ncbi:hypothetical protein CMUS01_01502 [Colletotrichum musicola]|uniref:C3H1-type domain-containing protein n=1 Tax=Colletotrichum musicola TaxID=2175873 RepID=A0A8H6U7Z8_9PEZI|nr:hypothetical protein CMUS01_01502 [Colletotrichum musicola]